MKRIRIDIRMDSDAFIEFPEIELAAILRIVADKVNPMLDLEALNGGLRDSNGNTVGTIKIT